MSRTSLRNLLLSIAVLLSVVSRVSATTMPTDLKGRVVGPDGMPIAGATVKIDNPVSGRNMETTTDENGNFTIYNLPHNPYTLTVDSPNFQTFTNNIDVHNDVIVNLGDITLNLTGTSEVITVSGINTQLVEPDNTSSHLDIDKSLIKRFPAAVSSRGTEQILLTTPGFIADENGRSHFRGSHGQISYNIDGVPVNDQLQVTFSNNLDPSTISAIEVTTGGLAAEYGDRAAVVNVTTKSGLEGDRNFFGNISYGFSRFATHEAGIQFGGASANKKFGYFGSFAGSVSNRFLDPINFENFHNRGNTERFFTRLDFQPTSNDKFTINFASGRTDHEVPNLLSQTLAGQDQSILNRDGSVSIGYTHIINPQAFLELRPYLRISQQQLFASPNDTPLSSTFGRRLTNYGFKANLVVEKGGNHLKTGVEVRAFPLREYLSFLITDPSYNAPFLRADGSPDPNDSPSNAHNLNPDYKPTLTPYDATRINQATGQAGAPFFFSGKRTGKEYTFFIQDSYKLKNLTINAGVRVSNYRDFVQDTGTQPRVALSYYIPQTGTVLRASYDRLFITPENEGLLITSSPDVIAVAGTGAVMIRPEIQNSYEIGFQQRIKNYLRIDGAYYTKDSRNTQDNDQFLNTGLLFPTAFAGAKLKGFDLRVDVPEHLGITSYFSFGTTSAVYFPPPTGGLLDELPTANFRIDHDQKVSIQGGVEYSPKKGNWWMGVDARYDSGLVTNFDPAVLTNPDLAFGAQYVRGTDDPLAPFRIRPRATFNYSAGIDLLKETHHAVNLQFNLLNFTDKKGLYNFLSPFGGTHVIPPRTYALKVKFNF